ncbi:MAG: hypothetical protein K2P84_03550 [Undibacterium sp.]|nr:hypothetical protein [Undibacterium sp.]
MGKRRILLVTLYVCVLHQDAAADIYRCTNSQGKKLASDRPIPECVNVVVKVYSNSGTLKQELLPPPSAEEKRRVAAIQEKQKQEQLVEEARGKEERYLLAHYRNENDIELARKKALEVVLDKKRMAAEHIESLNQTLKDLQNEQKMIKSGKNKKSSRGDEAAAQRLEDLSNTINRNQAVITTMDEEMLHIGHEYDAILERFRKIIGKGTK